MHRFLVSLSLVPRVAGLALKVSVTGGRALVRLAAARRRGLRGFRQGLAEAGLPPEAIDALAEEFPSFGLKQALAARNWVGTPTDPGQAAQRSRDPRMPASL